MQKTKYKRLSIEERELISRSLTGGISVRRIAEKLGRSPSTISREIKKPIKHSGYCADCTQRQAQNNASLRRGGRYKLMSNANLHNYVIKKLNCFWSPEQIAESLLRGYPEDTNMRIGKDAIYDWLYVQPSKELRKLLRFGHIRRRKRGRPKKSEKVGKISNMSLIDERPDEVLSRLVPGHWEGDLIKGGYNQSALGTLVERTTRYTILVPLKSFDANNVRKAFSKELVSLPEDIRKTLTYDQGKEMSEHLKLTLDTGTKVYFAHKRAPWERGTNENTNGLIRQFFPKGTDFSQVSRKRIKEVQALLNDRPRKVLGFKKPDEVFLEVLR